MKVGFVTFSIFQLSAMIEVTILDLPINIFTLRLDKSITIKTVKERKKMTYLIRRYELKGWVTFLDLL